MCLFTSLELGLITNLAKHTHSAVLCSEVHPTGFNGADSQESVYRITAPEQLEVSRNMGKWKKIGGNAGYSCLMLSADKHYGERDGVLISGHSSNAELLALCT